MSFSGVVLALGAILAPTRFTIPHNYIVIYAAAPLIMLVLALRKEVTTVDAIVLLLVFVAWIAYVAVEGDPARDGDLPQPRDHRGGRRGRRHVRLNEEPGRLDDEPVRPAGWSGWINLGNVIGSLVFSVTGKLGIVVLAGGSIAIGSSVLRWHFPALLGLTGLSAYFLSTGQLKRWHGVVLLALYIAYWTVSFIVYGGAPVED